MKSLFLATAAVAAFAAAPALAQDGVGSFGVTYSNVDLELAGLDGEAEFAAIDAAVATPITADWTVTLDGAFLYAFDDALGSDASNVNGRIHASRTFGATRFGAFAGGQEVGDEQLWSFGAEAQHYMDKLTLTGSLAYETVDGTDADIWSLGGDAAYYVSPKFRVNGGLGYHTADLGGGVDTDAWSANVGGEYQIADTGMSVTGGWTHSELEDLDLTVDTLSVGVRFSFGGDLRARERAGADLGRTVAGLGAAVGAF